MTAAELSSARPSTSRGGFCPLTAIRLIDQIAFSVAPSATGAAIAYSHTGEPGGSLVMLALMLVATQAVIRANLPLHLMPASRTMLALTAPVIGVAASWLVTSAAGQPFAVGDYDAVILGAWLMLGFAAWLRISLCSGIRTRVSVIGSRDFAADFAAELEAAEVRSYEVIGWIGEETAPVGHDDLSWLGRLDQVREAVVDQHIHLLVCAPPDPGVSPRLADVWAAIADACLDLPVHVIEANQLYEDVLGHVPVGMIDDAWYRDILHPRFRAPGTFVKRGFDLIVGSLLVVWAAPVLAAAAIAIKAFDRGPVLYRQRRLGEYGEEFEMLKLRTMRVDAEADGPQWSRPGDERVTPVGALLRRLHLDELPQLWNVLAGQMTLVGPRPERPEITTELELKFPHYTRRHLVKPGIAGWAALRCGYAGSELATAWKLCHDLFYIKRRSVVVDALILSETAVEVFRNAHRTLRAPGQRFLMRTEARG